MKISKTDVKPGLHIVVRVAEHSCDDASKRILKPSAYRLQIFLVRDQYLRSLPPYGDQATAGQLEKHVLKPMLAILTTYMGPGLKVQWPDRDQRKLKKTNMAQCFLAVVQKVKYCIGTKSLSLSRPNTFKIPICKHHKM